MLSIGELSKRTGVKVPTIRYYEQMGLIREADRSDGNQRRYEKTDLERLNIDAIRELIALSQHRQMPCEGADRIAAEHLAHVREKIASLKKLEHELERIVSHCHGHSIEDCYVIRALSNHGMCEGEH
jgi:DNA-binding transcriptional MerR regulator